MRSAPPCCFAVVGNEPKPIETEKIRQRIRSGSLSLLRYVPELELCCMSKPDLHRVAEGGRRPIVRSSRFVEGPGCNSSPSRKQRPQTRAGSPGVSSQPPIQARSRSRSAKRSKITAEMLSEAACGRVPQISVDNRRVDS